MLGPGLWVSHTAMQSSCFPLMCFYSSVILTMKWIVFLLHNLFVLFLLGSSICQSGFFADTCNFYPAVLFCSRKYWLRAFFKSAPCTGSLSHQHAIDVCKHNCHSWFVCFFLTLEWSRLPFVMAVSFVHHCSICFRIPMCLFTEL